MSRLINWFEIPATDFERAVSFYEAVFSIRLTRETFGSGQMAIFPYADPATGGAVCCMENYAPGDSGVIIYLDGGDDLAAPLERVWASGGKVLVAKTLITPEIGYFALFQDCEGNRIGLHSLH